MLGSLQLQRKPVPLLASTGIHMHVCTHTYTCTWMKIYLKTIMLIAFEFPVPCCLLWSPWCSANGSSLYHTSILKVVLNFHGNTIATFSLFKCLIWIIRLPMCWIHIEVYVSKFASLILDSLRVFHNILKYCYSNMTSANSWNVS